MAVAVTEIDEVQLPRTQSGPNPQHLIVTLLGDYWCDRTERLPSSGLVALATEFGITTTSARAALSRLARRGLLDPAKVGRRTYYALTARAREILDTSVERTMSFGNAGESWDGSWVVAAFTVPEDRRDVRHLVRTNLRWSGFAPLYDGVWVTPGNDPAEALATLGELGVTNSTVFVSRLPTDGQGRDPLDAWDLDELRAAYDDFLAEFAPVLERVRTGHMGTSEALVARIRLTDEWRRFPNMDPGLPDGAFPDGWPRATARRLFSDLYDALGPLAEVRIRQVLAEHDPELATRARHLSAAARAERARGAGGADVRVLTRSDGA